MPEKKTCEPLVHHPARIRDKIPQQDSSQSKDYFDLLYE